MSKLLIITQCQENYGSHDWDGQGECPQYWKLKPGSEYVIENIESYGFNNLDEAVTKLIASASEEINYSGISIREFIIGHTIIDDNELTTFEKDQLEYDGSIVYHSERLIFPSMMN